jgi:hypothetical protein
MDSDQEASLEEVSVRKTLILHAFPVMSGGKEMRPCMYLPRELGTQNVICVHEIVEIKFLFTLWVFIMIITYSFMFENL